MSHYKNNSYSTCCDGKNKVPSKFQVQNDSGTVYGNWCQPSSGGATGPTGAAGLRGPTGATGATGANGSTLPQSYASLLMTTNPSQIISTSDSTGAILAGIELISGSNPVSASFNLLPPANYGSSTKFFAVRNNSGTSQTIDQGVTKPIIIDDNESVLFLWQPQQQLWIPLNM